MASFAELLESEPWTSLNNAKRVRCDLFLQPEQSQPFKVCPSGEGLIFIHNSSWQCAHVLPIKYAGGDETSNLRVLCATDEHMYAYFRNRGKLSTVNMLGVNRFAYELDLATSRYRMKKEWDLYPKATGVLQHTSDW